MAQPQLAETSAPFLDDQVLFPEEPHAWYRIPSIVVAKSGVVLAFAERRIGTNHDWGHDSESSDRTVDTHIKTLRTKLREVDPDADPIRTQRGLGYALQVD